MSDITVGFVGMTHLAINSIAAMAARGFDVVGFDPDNNRTYALDRGELPFTEPDLPEYFAKHGQRMTFSSDTKILERCDVVYVAPDVTTDDRGASDLEPLFDLIGVANASMRDDAILVILSQVPPGFTRRLTRTKSTLFCQVETLIFGRAVERAMHPERYIVGCDDPAKPLPPAFAEVLKRYHCPVLPMRYESAELCKISINMFLVASVTTSNVIGELCEAIGADWSEIAPALRLDRRIGPHAYLNPGLGISGGNLERDLTTFCNFSDEHGTDSSVVRAWIGNSSYRKDWPLRVLHRYVLAQSDVSVLGLLGLTYKENTNSIKNSPSLRLLHALKSIEIRAYDPAAPEAEDYHPNFTRLDAAIDAVDGVVALVIMTPWPEFRALSPVEIASRMRGDTVIDPYRMLDPQACADAGLRHIVLGRQHAGET
jgi:UDPglucose 6-dehydrogenase